MKASNVSRISFILDNLTQLKNWRTRQMLLGQLTTRKKLKFPYP